MKKTILALAALLCTSMAHAAPYDSTFRDDSVEVVYTSPAVVTSTAALIVDLSDTTNWPHKKTSSINVVGVWVDFDKAGASTDTVKVGVVTNIDASSGTVKWFYVAGNTANHVSTPGPVSPVISGLIRTKVSSNATPFILTNNVSSQSTLFQTDVTLPTANSTFVAPAIGDIVAFIEGGGTAATLTATIHLIYSAER
jgi:hypothetical protein